MLRKILTSFLVVALLASLCITGVVVGEETPAQAELVEVMQILSISQNGDMNLVVDIENPFPNAMNVGLYQAKMDEKDLQIVEGYENTEALIASKEKTWIYFVDVSTVSNRTDNLIDVLKELVNNMGDGDNASIVTTANPKVVEVIKNKDTLIASMDNTTKQNKDAKQLYQAIGQTIDSLADCGEIHRNVRLVIFSDGKNDNQEGLPLADLQRKISESGIIVYPLIFSDDSADNLKSLAGSETAKGQWFAERTGRKRVETMAGGIKSHEESLAKTESQETKLPIFTLVIEQPETRGDNRLQITFGNGTSTAASNLAEDIICKEDANFFLKWINGLKKHELVSIAILAGLVVLIVGIIVLIVVLTKKKPLPDIPEPKNDETDPDVNSGEVVVPPVDPVLKVSLRESNGVVHEVKMPEAGLTAGRDATCTVVLPDSDRKISHRHFVIKEANGKLLITNISTTNGVYINNMKINGPMELRQQDKIRVGDLEMTITWKYE